MTNTRSCQPPGLTILKDFILPDEELQLMESLEWEADGENLLLIEITIILHNIIMRDLLIFISNF